MNRDLAVTGPLLQSPPRASVSRFTFSSGDRPLEGYTIKRGIGRGGFGEVYYAVSDGGKEVALKLVQRNLEVELRGVSQCLNLKHPNLVSLYDVKQADNGDYWVVMEYVSGESLAEVLDRYPQGLPKDQVDQWVRGICAGIGYLHDRGIVHRDLKPANVFIEEGVVKIGDYGLSKFITASRRSGQTESVGTVHYMAPEIANGRYGKEIDVYAVGIMVYEMLTGQVPFEGESVGEILMKHLTATPDLAMLPDPCRAAVARALAKDPQQRFETVADLVRELGVPGASSSAPVASLPPQATVPAGPALRGEAVALPYPSAQPVSPGFLPLLMFFAAAHVMGVGVGLLVGGAIAFRLLHTMEYAPLIAIGAGFLTTAFLGAVLVARRSPCVAWRVPLVGYTALGMGMAAAPFWEIQGIADDFKIGMLSVGTGFLTLALSGTTMLRSNPVLWRLALIVGLPLSAGFFTTVAVNAGTASEEASVMFGVGTGLLAACAVLFFSAVTAIGVRKTAQAAASPSPLGQPATWPSRQESNAGNEYPSVNPFAVLFHVMFSAIAVKIMLAILELKVPNVMVAIMVGALVALQYAAPRWRRLSGREVAAPYVARVPLLACKQC